MSRAQRSQRKLLFAALLGLTSLFLTVTEVRAGTLIINISDGTTSYDIFDQIPPDTNFFLNEIQADPLTILFPDYNIVSLSASSNNPGLADPDGAFVQVAATVSRLTAGSSSLTITAYQTDFNLPTAASFNLRNITSANYVNAGQSSTQTAEAWYNSGSPATPPPPFGTPASQIALPLTRSNSGAATTTLTGLPTSSDFSLTTQLVITLTNIGAQDSSSSTAQIEGASVPEPCSVIMLGTGAPLALALIRRAHARKQTAA